MSYGDDARRKRIALISFSSIFLIAMVVAVTVGVSLKKNDSSDSKNDSTSHEASTSMKAVQSICAPTDYKQECVSSLSSEAGNTTDPKELVKAAFKVAMKQISEGAKKSTLLKELEKDPRTQKALEDCKTLMDFSIGELDHSFRRFGEFDISQLDEMLIDLRIWLSAVITYQESCVDGFQNTTSNAGAKMRAALNTSMQLSSNGLAIATELSSVLKDLQIPGINRRRLLGEAVLPVLGHDVSIPDQWSNPGVRKLLQASTADTKPDVVVAKDGSGKFKTINEALLQIPKNNSKPFVIYVKAGIYKEYVHFTREMTHVVLIGDGATKTRITGDKNFVDGIPIFRTATVCTYF
jgi:pectinesterase